MRYGLIGPRDFHGEVYDNYKYVEEVLASFPDLSALVSGGSRGVETLAEKYARDTDLPFSVVRPNLRQYERLQAFEMRNLEIIQQSEAMIVFWDGETRLTINTLSHCMKILMEVTLIPMV